MKHNINQSINQSINQPIISFIIPIFNTQDYLVECLESILQQEIEKEIILIDDGSKDQSLNIALYYVSKYSFVTLIHSQNKGLSSARNKGIRLARGKYIHFVDSDDYLLGNNLSQFCDIASQKDIDIIRLQAQINEPINQFKTQTLILPSAYPDIEKGRGYLFSGYQFLHLMVSREWLPATCWTLIRREFLLENNLFFLEGVKAEDQLFYVQLLTCQNDVKVLEIDFIIYNYRKRAGSITTKPDAQFVLDHFQIVNCLYDWIIKNKFEESSKIDVYKIIAILYRNAFFFYSRLSPEGQEKYKSLFTPELFDFIKTYSDF